MASSYIKDLSRFPTSVSGDQIVQNIIQVGQSDGIGAVSLDHDFYGISQQGRVFSMASFRVVESGPNTNRGTLELHLYNSDGVSVPILTIGEDGTTVNGSFNVKGEHTSIETTSVVVEDKDMVLASGARSQQDLDGGGIVLGTADSGLKTWLYSSDENTWNSNIGVNIDAGAAFTVGGTQTVLSGTGLTVGEVALSPGSLRLASDVYLGSDGLELGDTSVTPLGGLVIGSSDGDVVVNESGFAIGNDLSLAAGTGLTLGSDVSLDQGGLHLKNADISLGADGLELGDTSVTPLGGLVIGSSDGDVVVDKSGFAIGGDLSLTADAGLTLGPDVLLDQGGLHLKNADISLGADGLELGDISVAPLGGLVIGSSGGDVVVDKSGFAIGGDLSLTADAGLTLGPDVLLDQGGLHLKNAEAGVHLGETGWKIAYDSASQHLAFKFYDSTSNAYVTKAEIKA